MTKHEPILREIEDRIRGGIKKVTKAEMEYVHTEREKEKARDQRTRELSEVRLEWVEEPVKWEPAQVIVSIGGQDRMFIVEPHETVDGKERLTKEIIALGYKGVAEKWAMWKWHGDRGSELNETEDTYIVDCKLPKLAWKAEKKQPVTA